MAKTEHSKIPVRLVKTGTGSYIVDASGALVDKAYLVTAANSFYPMLEALKEAEGILGNMPANNLEDRKVYLEVLEAIKNAEAE